ncbi:MAG TPA: 2-oxoglutarate dehydrogenase E1 component [Bdellovibrionales bacterium]|nr:2-oxoglutarate dehydrogenase E1 component [Bdellovibrionales bacterium]
MENFSYINQSNLAYIEGLYQNFRENPDSIQGEWRLFFQGVEFAKDLTTQTGLSLKELDVFRLINAYRDYGHFEANLNPLAVGPKSFPELSLLNFNLNESDLDSKFEVGAIVGKKGATLREIIAHLRSCYCHTISVQVAEAMPTVRNWFINEFENAGPNWQLSNEQKKTIFDQVAKTESFEKFLGTRYVGKKRFSAEGCDAIIPMLEYLAVKGSQLGVEEIVVGMAHRGRLNVLTNFMEKGFDGMFAEFEGVRDEHNSFFDGDVKYHMGYSSDKKIPGGATVHLSLAYNPSHLEAVNPVVLGMVRAKQRRRKDTSERKKVVPVLLHGDAAFAGQGVVAETFQMSMLPGYTIGGTVHVCMDNQIGFTAKPEQTRSSPYASDIAKMLQTPVIHVNADDVENCVRAVDIAIRFRQEFKRDIVINMIGYRRFGHNEGDEPAFTSPLMYDKIKKHPTLYDIYAQKLVRDGLISDDDPERIFKEKIESLQNILDTVKKTPPKMKPLVFDGFWKGMRRSTPDDFKIDANTKTKKDFIEKSANLLTNLPSSFTPHPKLVKLLDSRKAMLDGAGHIDWGMAELLAYGTLMYEGTPVRISGQDVVRGTFTHRHAAYYDVKTGERYTPFSQINPDDVEFVIYDSLLSEYAVLGFEYGNSSSDPTFLTIWEAQFGDFANGAQIIIDQFLASAEQKWQRMSGLVLLLPHGYEGQGPEHSSARVERFLQLCAQDNMQVVNLTTPAQIFHALRRQVKRDFRKPLVIMSPKSLLRHPKVISQTKELYDGQFHEVLPDTATPARSVETLVLCSGKVYYDIMAKKEELEVAGDGVAVVRVEQLYPFPEHKVAAVIRSYPNLKRILWTQEEPKNMGAWSFMLPHLLEMKSVMALDNVEVAYNGRTERASPATGSEKVHQAEQKEIVARCFEMSNIASLKKAK